MIEIINVETATTTYQIVNAVTSDQIDYLITISLIIAVLLGLQLVRGLLQLFTNR